MGDHMVLQQNSSVKLWGWADGKKVTVTTSWNNRTYQASTDKDGAWLVKVDTPKGGYTPYSITISDGTPVTLSDILIGEVWICSGQSNMEMRMMGNTAQPIDNSLETLLNAGNYRDPKVVEKVLESGDVDIVGMGRGLIAEPNWVKKVENGEEDILRKCISCNVGCAGNRIGVNRPIRCTVNPAVPEGDIYKALKVNKNCNVVVVGGGTAGMEAACTAAEVGCNVFVLEKKDHLGGLSTFISDLPSKTRMKDFPKYLEARAARLKNLYVFLNTEATVEKVKQFKPDIVVNATGSVPLVPPIKGLKENIEAGNVATIFDMINNLNAGKYPDDFCKGKKVVVVGGGSVGLDVVEYFAPRGAKCTIVDMLPQIGMMADPITKCSMRETHDKYGVKEYVNTALQEVKENAFTVKLPDGTIEDLNFDLGFNCLGMRANNPILAQLEEAFDNTDTFIYPIGDSVRARRIMEGTMEGRAILNVLEARGFLELAPLE